ncbi:MAG: Gfo/Idh/MocA family oxidoreductase [Phenylobacterium sp.]|uniref:Gfo/Idh/MocA family oxidoreductase n=1 Tax=Phenylobacterium sp. TaxID=1871053 RepID=UPI002733DDD4|nr:Gfo/Idh/MocA family oxidoreductase [Phenylobacterium sp.]MDP3174725.1 Gfo/Idh/MocA family oxidoreductase [Phenylobacterium sp.]
MLDVAIIGAGLMGRWHLATARRLGARIVAVVDPDAAAATALARDAPGALTYPTARAMLSVGGVVAAHVCTPAATHLPIALELIGAGVHALIEKPAVETRDEAEQLAQAALAAGVQICPVHQYAFQPALSRAIRRLPALGALRRIDLDICSAGAEGGPAARQTKVLGEILPHPLSIIQRVTPDVALDALDWRTVRAAPGELLATADAQGVLISIFISLDARPTRFALQLQTRGGTIAIDGFHGFSVELDGQVSRVAKITGPFTTAGRTLAAASANLLGRAARREGAYVGLRDLTRAFYSAVRASDPAAQPISLDAIVAGAAARETILSGSAP